MLRVTGPERLEYESLNFRAYLHSEVLKILKMWTEEGGSTLATISLVRIVLAIFDFVAATVVGEALPQACRVFTAESRATRNVAARIHII